MCRQAWFKPGDSARDVGKLTEFFATLERSCGGHGNGAGWVDVDGTGYDTEKAMTRTVEECAAHVARRPATAWGIFHTRLASAGGKSDAGCHPHVYECKRKDNKRIVVLTHNGTWMAWRGACVAMRAKYPTDSATIAALVSMFGFKKIAAEVDETIIAAIRDDGKWRIRAWRDHYPLVQLANGGVASEGGDGEFAATAVLCRGPHSLTGTKGPRTEAVKVTSSVGPYSFRGDDGRFKSSYFGSQVKLASEPEPEPTVDAGDVAEAQADESSSDYADRVAQEEWESYLSDSCVARAGTEGYIYLKGHDGVFRPVRKGKGKDDPALFLPGHVSVKS